MVERYDLMVIGAGPAGLAAASAAATQGARVALVDSQPQAGGQVWRQDIVHGQDALARRSIDAALGSPRVDYLAQTQVIAAAPDRLLLQDPQHGYEIGGDALLLAQGARELLLPFPGWTLPGVTGAGGLQALAKQGWPLAGKRVLIAGSGPLLLAAAATARRHGATVLGIHEQAPPSALRAMAGQLWRWPAKAAQAAQLRWQLRGIGYRAGSVVTAAVGDQAVRAAIIQGPQGLREVACDLLAVGYGLVPSTELASLLGCTLQRRGRHPAVQVDAWQRSSLPGVFAAGEQCGIGGRDCARLEGRIAALAATGTSVPADLLRQRDHQRRFADALARHFAIGPQVHALAQPDTLVCRCEDVPLGALAGHADSRAAKLATRCGMGACQGRICGSALAELDHFPRRGQRPPVFPARLATLGEAELTTDREPRGIQP